MDGDTIRNEEKGNNGNEAAAYEKGNILEDTASLKSEHIYSETDSSSHLTTPPKKRQFPGANIPVPDGPAILEPNHPLLVKFQATLKAQLTRQLEKLIIEVRDLEEDIKTKDTTREQVGLELYTIQQSVAKQQQVLSEYIKTYSEISQLRTSIEEQIKEQKSVQLELTEQLKNEEIKERQFIAEFEENARFQKQLEDWQKRTDIELSLNQRMSEKDKAEKSRLIEEQKKMDMLMYNLSAELRKLETEKCVLSIQMRYVEDKLGVVRQSLLEANADYEALHAEQKRLLTLWGGVVISIQQRDKLLIRTKKSLSETNDKVALLKAEVEGYHRKSQNEMQTNEKLLTLKTRMQLDITNAERSIQELTEKLDGLDKKLLGIKALSEQTEQDIADADHQNFKLNCILGPIQTEINKQIILKEEMEEQMLALLADQLINNKAAQYMSKKFKELQAESRKQEILLQSLENTLAKLSFDIEKCRNTVAQNKIRYEEANSELEAYDKELQKKRDEMNKGEQAAIRKQCQIDVLNKKLEVLIQQAGGSDMSPLVLKIQNVEKGIQDANDLRARQEPLWLRLQGHIVAISKRRNEQQQAIHVLRKQILIIHHKSATLDRDLNALEKDKENMEKRMGLLITKLAYLAGQLSQRRGFKEEALKKCEFNQEQLVTKLREEELKCVNLNSEISVLKNEISDMEEVLLSKQKEALVWDGKTRQTANTIKVFKQESKRAVNADDIIVMKNEVHRMRIRLEHLSQIQVKLVHDLDICMSQRDVIIEKIDIRNQKGESEKTSKQMLMKINDMKQSVRKCRQDIKATEKTIAEMTQQQQLFIQDVEEIKAAQAQQHHENQKLQDEINHSILLKNMNVEILVRKQHRSKKIGLLQDHHIKQLSLRNDSIALSLDKYNSMNNRLREAIVALRDDFPDLKMQFEKIFNTLEKREI